METAIVYCRKSNESALPTDVSFDDQEAAGRKHADEKGYAVLKVLKESHSGADLKGRPLIWEAIDDVKRGDAQVLIVRNYDRLARKPEHQGVILYNVEEEAGGRVESVLEPIDENDVMAKTVRGIMAVVAEAERLNAVARMERGKRNRAARGELMGASNPKYGWVWLDDEPGKRTAYLEDIETAPVVRRIFHLAKQGTSLRGIAKILNDDHVPTPSQISAARGYIGRHKVGERWRAGAVLRILTDRAYIGEALSYKWVRTKTKKGKTGHALRAAGTVSISVPALVDRDTYNLVQQTISHPELNGRPPIDAEASWLRGHVYCGVCGARLTIRRDKDQKYVYHCRNRSGSSPDGVDCPGGAFKVRSHLLDPFAYGELTRTVEHLEPLRDLMIKRLGTDKTQVLASMAEGFAAQLADKQADRETAMRRSMQTRDEDLAQRFIHEAETLGEQLRTLEKEYKETRAQLDEFTAGNAWVDATLARIRANVPTDNPSEADIRALPFDMRRLLLDASGLFLQVYPTGYRKDGKRVTTGWLWAWGPADRVQKDKEYGTVSETWKQSHPSRGTRRSSGSPRLARTAGW